MSTATLPEHMEENAIRGMSPDDVGFTVPWAIWVDRDRQMWINGNYTTHSEPGGTVCMKIKRLKSSVRVYKQTIGDYKFNLLPSSPYIGGSDDMPVEMR